MPSTKEKLEKFEQRLERKSRTAHIHYALPHQQEEE